MEESVQIKVLCEHTVVDGALYYTYSGEDQELIDLHVKTGVREMSASGANCFSALTQLRKEMEAFRMFPLIMGANRIVYPSPMQLCMGDGRMAYIQNMGKPAGLSDSVDIFASCNQEDVVSVLEQEKYHEEWLLSIRNNLGK